MCRAARVWAVGPLAAGCGWRPCSWLGVGRGVASGRVRAGVGGGPGVGVGLLAAGWWVCVGPAWAGSARARAREAGPRRDAHGGGLASVHGPVPAFRLRFRRPLRSVVGGVRRRPVPRLCRTAGHRPGALLRADRSVARPALRRRLGTAARPAAGPDVSAPVHARGVRPDTAARGARAVRDAQRAGAAGPRTAGPHADPGGLSPRRSPRAPSNSSSRPSSGWPPASSTTSSRRAGAICSRRSRSRYRSR